MQFTQPPPHPLEDKALRLQVYKTCLKMLWNQPNKFQAAEDAAQETLLNAFRQFHQFRGECEINTWLYRIATNTCYSFLRASLRYKNMNRNVISIDEAELMGFPQLKYEEKPPDPIEHNTVWACMHCLPPQDQLIMRMWASGESTKEMSIATGLHPSTVKTRISKSKIRLRNNLPLA